MWVRLATCHSTLYEATQAILRLSGDMPQVRTNGLYCSSEFMWSSCGRVLDREVSEGHLRHWRDLSLCGSVGTRRGVLDVHPVDRTSNPATHTAGAE